MSFLHCFFHVRYFPSNLFVIVIMFLLLFVHSFARGWRMEYAVSFLFNSLVLMYVDVQYSAVQCSDGVWYSIVSIVCLDQKSSP
ncbi:hypothetical protein DL95DRAFT_379226, partial [Leptodontidium sp. 2 PMI_412]